MQMYPGQGSEVKPSYNYYAYKFSNTGNSYVPASFNLAKVVPILRESNKYVMTVAKLTVSTNTIPRMYSYINSFDVGNTDPNQTIWSLALNYNGKFVNNFIEHVPQTQNNGQVPPPLTAINRYQDLSQQYQRYYGIDSIQHWIDMMNTCLTTTFTQLQAFVAPALATTTAPQFVFDRTTGFIDLVADINFYGPQVATPVEIFMSANLKTMMRNYNYFEETSLGDYFKFIMRNEAGDTTNTYCRQECEQLDQLSNSFVELAVSSSNMGVRPSYSDGSSDIGEINQTNQQSLTQSRSLITSFSVQETPQGNSQRIRTTYVPQNGGRKTVGNEKLGIIHSKNRLEEPFKILCC